MNAQGCLAAIMGVDAPKRAGSLDEAFPNCVCEAWSLTEKGGPGIGNDEPVARILTTPDHFNEADQTIVTQKLTQLYAMGMSVIRMGASDEEIKQTVDDLLSSGAEPRKLYGAIVVPAEKIRSYANEDDLARWFGVYATDDRGKEHHGDVFGTSVSRNKQQKRRHLLATDLLSYIVRAESKDDLVTALRASGI